MVFGWTFTTFFAKAESQTYKLTDKEYKMGFEKVILNEVRQTEPDVEAYFYSGTLFYQATERQSRRIFSNLFRRQNGQITITVVGSEYAVDFVAEKQQSNSEQFSPFCTVNS